MWWRRKSKEKAKERLKLVLAYDRARLSPGMVESLKRDLLEVLRRYRHREDKARAVRFLEGRGFPLGVALEAWRLAQEEEEGYK